MNNYTLFDNLTHLTQFHDKCVVQYASGAINPFAINGYERRWQIERHLKGEERRGAYCPNSDGATTFAVIDIDGGPDHAVANEDPEATLVDYCQRLEDRDIQYYACQSRSLQGYHIWIIFEAPVHAYAVRTLLRDILHPNAKKPPQGVDLFPKQDRAKGKGYGNFVWLPYFGGQDTTLDGSLDHRNTPDILTQHMGTPTTNAPDAPESISSPTGRFTNVASTNANLGSLARPIPPLRPFVEMMLLHIDATEYHQWYTVLLALYATYGNEAREAALEWSKYANNFEQHAFDAKWEEFQTFDRDTIEVQINSIIHLAKSPDDGNPWDSSKWDDYCIEYLAEQRRITANTAGAATDPVTGAELVQPDEAADFAIAEAIMELLADHPDINVLFAAGRQWYYEADKGIWRPMETGEFYSRFIAPYHGTFAKPYFDSKGNEKYPEIKISASMTKNIRACLEDKGLSSASPMPPRTPGVSFRNGFLNDEGALESHTPEHYCLDYKDFDFDHAARNEFFEEWLRGTLGDDNTYKMIQEFAGAALFGQCTKLQKGLMLYGKPATGKSQLLNIFRHFFGDTATSIGPQHFGKEYLRAKLVGKKISLVEEVPPWAFRSTMYIKNIISGGEIQAREKYGKAFEFMSEAGLMFTANQLPDTYNVEDGIWRRILIAKFDNVVPVEDRRPNFFEHIQAGAPPSWFAAWCVQGYIRLQHQKYQVTPNAPGDDVMEEWKEHADPVLEFMSECLAKPDESEGGFASYKEVHGEYKRWCRETGNNSLTRRQLTSRLTNLGYKRSRTSDARGFEMKILSQQY